MPVSLDCREERVDVAIANGSTATARGENVENLSLRRPDVESWPPCGENAVDLRWHNQSGHCIFQSDDVDVTGGEILRQEFP